jgi:hypothetical protein
MGKAFINPEEGIELQRLYGELSKHTNGRLPHFARSRQARFLRVNLSLVFWQRKKESRASSSGLRKFRTPSDHATKLRDAPTVTVIGAQSIKHQRLAACEE